MFRSCVFVALSIAVSAGCQKKKDSTEITSGLPQYLYVTSGGCSVGTLTPEAASRTITRINLDTGNVNDTVIDYNASSPGDTPVGLLDYDTTRILVLIENASGRRLDLVNKIGGQFTTYLTNSTALNAVMRGLAFTADGGLLVAKTSAIEKFSSNKSRALAGAAAWVTAPGGSCATSTSIVSVTTLQNGNIVYLNSAASQNRIGIVTGATGYLAAADCKNAMAAPSLANSYPTSMVYLADAHILLVAYASLTAGNDFIYAYDINETTNTISGATKAYENASILRGASSMTYDSETGYLYVANGSTSLSNTIEKFTFSAATKLLTRVGTTSFSMPTINHRCISSMQIF